MYAVASASISCCNVCSRIVRNTSTSAAASWSSRSVGGILCVAIRGPPWLVVRDPNENPAEALVVYSSPDEPATSLLHHTTGRKWPTVRVQAGQATHSGQGMQ